MNTLTQVTPIDLYEKERQEDNAQLTSASRLLALTSNDPNANVHVDLGQKGAPLGAPSEAEKQDSSIGSTIWRGIDLITAPLSSLSNALFAPIAHDYKSNTFGGEVEEAAKVAKDAFLGSFVPPKEGQERKDYVYDAVDKFLPGLPKPLKTIMSFGLGMVTDPAIILGVPMLKAVQRGLRVAKDVSKGVEAAEGFEGFIKAGVQKIVAAGKDFEPEEISKLTELARKADRGDAAAIEELNNFANNDKRFIDAAQKLEDEDIQKTMKHYNEVLGDREAPDFTLVTDVEPEQLLREVDNPDAKYIGSINIHKIDGKKDINKLITNVYATFKEKMDKLTESMTDEERLKLTNKLNNSLTDFMGRKHTAFTDIEALTMRQILVTLTEQLRTATAAVIHNPDSGIHRLVFNKTLTIQKEVQAKVNGIASHAGKLLHVFKITAKSSRAQLRQINKMIAEAAGTADPRVEKILQKMVAEFQDNTNLNRFVNKTHTKSWWDAIYEFFTNSILSGPITHAINSTSNQFVASLRIPAKAFEAMSAVARFDYTQAKLHAADAIGLMHGMMQTIGDGLRMLNLKGGIKAIEGPEALETMHELARQKLRPAITSEELHLKGRLGSIIDYFGRMVRLPGDMLLKEDKFFKIMNYRMSVNAEAARTAMQSGGTFKEVRSIYNALRGNPSENLIGRALDETAYYTFTKQLSGRMGHAAQFLHNTPFRYVIPFFRTPTNIIEMGLRNSTFGSIYDTFKGTMFMRNAAGDAARARFALGTMIPAYLLANLDDERITGAIDTRTPRGRFLAAQNHPAYSIKIGDTWYDYGRIEPLKTVLGLLVNAKEAFHNIDLTDPVTHEHLNTYDTTTEILTTLAAPFLKTVTNNYMLPNIGMLVNALNGLASGNPQYAWKQYQRLLSSFVPNALTQYTQQGNLWYSDPVYRRADNLIQMIWTKIPGMSQTLPARYTFWGDEQHRFPGVGIDLMSPIRTATMEPDFVDKEIERLGVNIPGVPKTISAGPGMPPIKLDLYKQAEFSKIRGKGFNGVSIKNVIKQVMTDKEFTGLPDAQKKAIIENIMLRATESAKQYLLATDFDLQKQLNVRLDAVRQLGGLK